jgi:hypothetical protein
MHLNTFPSFPRPAEGNQKTFKEGKRSWPGFVLIEVQTSFWKANSRHLISSQGQGQVSHSATGGPETGDSCTWTSFHSGISRWTREQGDCCTWTPFYNPTLGPETGGLLYVDTFLQCHTWTRDRGTAVHGHLSKMPHLDQRQGTAVGVHCTGFHYTKGEPETRAGLL